MTLVGLTGFARCGKDSIGETMEFRYKYRRYALADPIRKAASEIFGMPLNVFGGTNPNREQVDEFWGYSPRQMLQMLGTEAIRNVFGQDVWVKRAAMEWKTMRAMRSLEDNNMEVPYWNGMVVTDIRFDNEAQWVVGEGGTVVEVKRPGVAAVNTHVSEKGIDRKYISYTLYNDGTLSELDSKVYDLVSHIRSQEPRST